MNPNLFRSEIQNGCYTISDSQGRQVYKQPDYALNICDLCEVQRNNFWFCLKNVSASKLDILKHAHNQNMVVCFTRQLEGLFLSKQSLERIICIVDWHRLVVHRSCVRTCDFICVCLCVCVLGLIDVQHSSVCSDQSSGGFHFRLLPVERIDCCKWRCLQQKHSKAWCLSLFLSHKNVNMVKQHHSDNYIDTITVIWIIS